MDTTFATAPASSRPRIGLLALILAVAALSAAGMALAASLVSNGAPRAAAPSLPAGPFGTAEDIPTSFGVVAVEYAEKLNGLTAKDLAGTMHGIKGYVPPNKVQVQASATMTNLTDQPVVLLARRSSSSWPPRTRGHRHRPPRARAGEHERQGRAALQPDAAVDARLSFVAPRNGKRLLHPLHATRAAPSRWSSTSSAPRAATTPRARCQQHLHRRQARQVRKAR